MNNNNKIKECCWGPLALCCLCMLLHLYGGSSQSPWLCHVYSTLLSLSDDTLINACITWIKLISPAVKVF